MLVLYSGFRMLGFYAKSNLRVIDSDSNIIEIVIRWNILIYFQMQNVTLKCLRSEKLLIYFIVWNKRTVIIITIII